MTKAFCNPHRLEIMDLLAQGEKTVEVIAAEISASVANASQHLQVLKQAHLVTTRKQAHHIYYDLANADVFNTWYTLRSLSIRQMPQVKEVIRDFRHERDSLEAVSVDELYQRLHSDEVVLLDVRPTEEYQRGHIPHAISIPLEQWDSLLATLPRHKQIIAYCRGPFCVYSDEAVVQLKRKGYHAVRLEEGFPDWKKRGLPVAR
ncbi:MAG: metalloregulator ArsR/SmtB family transcription factor [Spirosoma sp.]|nr:metalloregulator ArsR/SmtB family transcription factor [Spirosoma sp.]